MSNNRLANWQQEHPNVDTSWEITPVARRDSIFDAESALANANNSNIASTKNLLEYQEDRGIAQVCENLADGLAENEIAVALQQTTTEIQNQTQHIQGGCTFSGCLVYGKNAHLINVGDSAIFGITHDGKAQRLTAPDKFEVPNSLQKLFPGEPLNNKLLDYFAHNHANNTQAADLDQLKNDFSKEYAKYENSEHGAKLKEARKAYETAKSAGDTKPRMFAKSLSAYQEALNALPSLRSIHEQITTVEINNAFNNNAFIQDQYEQYKAIKKQGGNITYSNSNFRVGMGGGTGAVSMTAAIGDNQIKGLLHTPTITSIPTANFKYFFAATDGITDHLDESVLTAICQKIHDKPAAEIAKSICEQAAICPGKKDNATISIISSTAHKSIAAVADGHNGEEVAEYVQKNFSATFEKKATENAINQIVDSIKTTKWDDNKRNKTIKIDNMTYKVPPEVAQIYQSLEGDKKKIPDANKRLLKAANVVNKLNINSLPTQITTFLLKTAKHAPHSEAIKTAQANNSISPSNSSTNISASDSNTSTSSNNSAKSSPSSSPASSPRNSIDLNSSNIDMTKVIEFGNQQLKKMQNKKSRGIKNIAKKAINALLNPFKKITNFSSKSESSKEDNLLQAIDEKINKSSPKEESKKQDEAHIGLKNH